MAAPQGLPVSIQTRLVSHAKDIGVDPNLVLTRYATERILYRLSRSAYADRFVLKGALLMLVWLGETIRPTRDADLLGFGDLSEESLTSIFRDLCVADVEPDGLRYLAKSIRVVPIRVEDAYGGLRVTIEARLGNARLLVQVDVGVGDAVVPELGLARVSSAARSASTTTSSVPAGDCDRREAACDGRTWRGQ